MSRTLETTNLIIRPSVWEDIDTFYQWELKPEVTRFFSIADNQTKEAVIRKFLADDQNPQSEQYTIMLKQDGEEPKRIGRIVLGDIEEGWKAEIWRIYIADTDLRGRGLGKEAMLAIMEYCFRDLGLARLYLDHYTGNPASYLYLSLGFQYEGVLRGNCRKNGVLYDVHLMSMMREEYESLQR